MTGSAQEKLTRLFSKRFPDRKSLWGIYAAIVFLIYSWTLITSFYKLPSWMFYLTIDQILSIYAYSFSLNLIESIFLLIGVLFLEFTLFLGLKDDQEFQTRCILVVSIFLASLMTRLVMFQGYEDSGAFVAGELLWWGIAIPAGLIIAVIGSKFKLLRQIFEAISDRISIFLYVYIPLSLLSLIIVLIRNIE